MITKELSESAVEITSIFNNMTDETIKKIPIDVINFFQEISSKDYFFQYDKTKKLNEQRLLPKTKGILAVIYRDYLCDDMEKKDYIEYCKKVNLELERQKSEKYDSNNIFEKRNLLKSKEAKEDIQEQEITIYQKESFIKKIFNKIKKFFIK